MIVYHRDESDPEFEPAGAASLQDMLGDLQEQGSTIGIGVQPQTSVPAIAQYVQFSERSMLV
jgi:hypothetical protein